MYIVDEIIKKAEKSTKDWRESATGGHKYWIKEDYDKVGRDTLNGELLELSEKGLIKVRWQNKPHEAEWFEYRTESLALFYELKMKENPLFKPKQQIVWEYQQFFWQRVLKKIHCIFIHTGSFLQ